MSLPSETRRAGARPRGGASERSDEAEAERREKRPEGWSGSGRGRGQGKGCQEGRLLTAAGAAVASRRGRSTEIALATRAIARPVDIPTVRARAYLAYATLVARFGDGRRQI